MQKGKEIDPETMAALQHLFGGNADVEEVTLRRNPNGGFRVTLQRLEGPVESGTIAGPVDWKQPKVPADPL